MLSECPLYLGLEPEEAEAWVRDEMEPVFPLGVKKDESDRAPYPPMPAPTFRPARVLATVRATSERQPRFASGFPTHLDPEDVSVKFAGSGGDGAQTAALALTRAAVAEGFDSTHIPSYGPESRGGTSYADVHVAKSEVLSPAVPKPHILVAFNAPSLVKFGPTVVSGGTILYDSSLIARLPDGLPGDLRVVAVRFAGTANDLGNVLVKNVVALGALQSSTELFPAETFLAAIRASLGGKPEMMALNERAFEEGARLAREAVSS